jgi:hypothetical protein
VDWTVILAALISALAALAGSVVGYRIEHHRSKEARKARSEDRDWHRHERKRQELTELQQALGDHVVRMDTLVADAINALPKGQPWQSLRRGFDKDNYESQLRVLFLATRTADEEVYGAVGDLIACCDLVMGAPSREDADLNVEVMTKSLGRADRLIFARLEVFDATPRPAP